MTRILATRLVAALAVTATGAATGQTTRPASPFRLLFWQAGDIRDGRNVRFAAHSFTQADRTVLLPADPQRPALWYMPSDVVRVGDEIRVYYQCVDKTFPLAADQRTFCVGVLQDGRLVLPKVNPEEPAGTASSNVVLRRSPYPPTWGGFNVFQMVHDPGNGFRLLYWDQPSEGNAGALLATSPDGLRWRKDETRAVFTETNDAFTLTRNPHGKGFLLYQTVLEDWPDKPFVDNLPGKRRVISIRESDDLRTWTKPQVILRPDAQDAPETEFYLMKVFSYADRLVGLLMVYYGDPTRPNQHSSLLRNELVFSNDGRRWDRPYRYSDIGVWTYADPLEHMGRLCIVAHHEHSLSLFHTRPDGLASCGSEQEGSFWTRSFTMPNTPLVLNADCRGGLVAVAVLDAKGAVITGYEDAACTLENASEPGLPLAWHRNSTAQLAGRTVHLRFRLRHADVFSVREASATTRSATCK